MSEARIISNSEVLNGEPHVEGTRISAWKIHDMYTTLKMSPEEIADELPTADIEHVEAAIEYTENQEEESKPAVTA